MVRTKIVSATQLLIEEKGIDVSVREIARCADVNVAAINYHFGNKANLINEIIVEKMMCFKSPFDNLLIGDIDNIERLEIFLIELIQLIENNSEVSEYILTYSDLFKTRYEYMEYLETIGYSNLIDLIRSITKIDDEEELLIIIEQTLTATVVGYIKEMKLENENIGFKKTADYKKRVNLFINNYFFKYIQER